MRRLMLENMKGGGDMAEWKELENRVLSAPEAINKEYADTYSEYIGYIRLPKSETPMKFANHMLLGSLILYYSQYGSASYDFEIVTHMKKIAPDFWMEEWTYKADCGVASPLNLESKIRKDKFQIKTITPELPTGTEIRVYAR